MKTGKKLDTSKLVKNWTWRFGKLVKNSQFSTGFLILDRPRKTGKKTKRKLKKTLRDVVHVKN